MKPRCRISYAIVIQYIISRFFYDSATIATIEVASDAFYCDSLQYQGSQGDLKLA
jgi:hypothetical protein